MKGKTKMLAVMCSPDDLDVLRAIFGPLAFEEREGEAKDESRICTRMMQAVKRCAKKHGFRWEH